MKSKFQRISLLDMKHVRRFLVAAIVMLMMAETIGCKKEAVISNTNIIIRKPGTYRVEGNDIRIVVRIEDRIVRYSVIKGEKRIIDSVERASSTQNWFVCWDEQSQLWFSSSDIGTFLWRLDSKTGDYHEISVADDAASNSSMPRQVLEAMPSSIRAFLKKKGT